MFVKNSTVAPLTMVARRMLTETRVRSFTRKRGVKVIIVEGVKQNILSLSVTIYYARVECSG